MEDVFSLAQLAWEIAEQGDVVTDDILQEKLVENGYHSDIAFENFANLVEQYGVEIIY